MPVSRRKYEALRDRNRRQIERLVTERDEAKEQAEADRHAAKTAARAFDEADRELQALRGQAKPGPHQVAEAPAPTADDKPLVEGGPISRKVSAETKLHRSEEARRSLHEQLRVAQQRVMELELAAARTKESVPAGREPGLTGEAVTA